MVGSEVYSSEVKKTEVLMENFRRAIGAPLAAAHVVSCCGFLLVACAAAAAGAAGWRA